MGNFDRALEFVLAQEGGYVSNPHDPGGETNMGISKHSYPTEDIKGMTRERAAVLYKRDFWDPLGLDLAADPWALFLFDSAVQHGLSKAREWRQRFNTLADAVWDRLGYYDALTHFTDFGKTWLKRMIDLRGVLRYEYGVFV